MSCHRKRHLDGNLKNSTIVRLLLAGKLNETNDSRPPPMDLSLKKSTQENSQKSGSFGVRELLSGRGVSAPPSSQNCSKYGESIKSKSSEQREHSALSSNGNAFVSSESPKNGNMIAPDSMTDSLARPATSPFVLSGRSKGQGFSNALRSLLMKPSLMQNKLNVGNLNNSNSSCSSTPAKPTIDNSEAPGKCSLAELSKYLCSSDTIFTDACNIAMQAHHWFNYNNNEACKDDKKLAGNVKCVLKTFPADDIKSERDYFTAKREEMPSKVDRVNAENDDLNFVGTESKSTLRDIKTEKMQLVVKSFNSGLRKKRKIKSESPETSELASTPEGAFVSNEDSKEGYKNPLKNSPAYDTSPADSKQMLFNANTDNKHSTESDKNECDYETFRKFKRFRKCFPANYGMSNSDNRTGCECILNGKFIQQISSSPDNKPPSDKETAFIRRDGRDMGTQCFIRESFFTSDAATQCNMLLSCCQDKKLEPESENGVTEGISMTSETLLKCFHCGITFEDDVIYSIHMGCHCHRDPYICNLCGRQCGNKYVFNTHILRGHQSA